MTSNFLAVKRGRYKSGFSEYGNSFPPMFTYCGKYFGNELKLLVIVYSQSSYESYATS